MSIPTFTDIHGEHEPKPSDLPPQDEEVEIVDGKEIESAAESRYFPGPLIFRRRLVKAEAMKKLSEGGVIYAGIHPLFFAAYLFLAIAFYTWAVWIDLQGDRAWIYVFSLAAAIMLFRYVWMVFVVRTQYIAVSLDVVVIQKGIIRPDPQLISIKEFSEAELKMPIRGLGWLHYATWKPVATGEHVDKPVKRIMYMADLQKIIIELKNQPEKDSRKHNVEDRKLQVTQNELLRQVVARLDDILYVLQSNGFQKVTATAIPTEADVAEDSSAEAASGPTDPAQEPPTDTAPIDIQSKNPDS